MLTFDNLVSITFQGTVIVFGRPTSGVTTDIWFNVLGQNVEANDTELDWEGFTRLEPSAQVREVGMSLITLGRASHTLAPSATPFSIVTDQKYISVVQQSARGTLMVNRYRLLSAKSGSNQKVTTYSLAPVWEVRFARSHNEDVPADKSDKPDYLDPDGKPFLEPTLELAMIDGVEDGAFSVLLLPISGKDSFAWQFLTRDKATNEIRLFNFPANDVGLFDLTGKKVDANHRILPDSRFSLKRDGGSDALALAGAPRAVTYMKHERVVQPDGTSIGVKRATRVMITQAVSEGGKTLTATVDSAVGPNGVMAKLDGPITATSMVPAAFDLAFDGLSELRLQAPGSGTNPLAVAGPFSIHLLLAPAQKGDGAWLVGGDASLAPDKAAPFLRVIDGDKLEFGFGTGSAAVRGVTLTQVLQPKVWSDIELAYTGPGDAPFVLKVNGTVVPQQPCTAPANPSGSPITRIGAATGGFLGALKSARIAVGGTDVVALDCEAVDYKTTPPTTPNSAASGVTVAVAGPKLEPSSSPVNSPMSGAFYIDAKGLTYYAGLADFIEPQSNFCLIEGSDGLLHLYYQGKDANLTVAQFSVDSARATFSDGWSTDWVAKANAKAKKNDRPQIFIHHGLPCEAWTPVAPRLLAAGQTQSGFLDFVAHRVGTYMNPTQITVRPSTASPLLCDVEVKAPGTVGTELWTGLPRDIAQFQSIWNGAASDNPDDRDVTSRARPYFDYSGRAPAVAVATGSGTDGAFFLFTSVPRLPLALAAMTVTAGSRPGTVTLNAETAAPPRWPTTEVLRQVWPDVAEDAQSVIETLSGKATRYDYGKVTTPGSRAYGLRISLARSDEQIGHVVLFVRNAQKEFRIRISDGASLTTCKVEICDQLLQDVPREQSAFIRVLNGDDQKFAYPPGYVDGLATMIYALGNGLSADVTNAAEAEQGAALAYAGMLRVLFQGSAFDRAVIAPQARTAAAAFQGATLTFDSQKTGLRGSLMFGAVTDTMPTNGGIGRLADTRTASNGIAALRIPGVNGGWMPVSPRFSLGMTATKTPNYVQVSVDKALPQTEDMAILGDLTVEGWLRQDEARAASLERVLTYNVTGTKDDATAPIRLMLGAKQGPALNLGRNTFVSRSFNFDPPALTVQFYLRLPDPVVTGTILTVTEINGGTEYLSLTLDAYGKVQLSFMGGAGKLASSSALPKGTWTCVTAIVAAADGGTVQLSLAVNDKAPVSTTATNSFTGKLGSLTLGSRNSQGIVAAANGISFWQRALTPEQVANSYLYGFADTDPMLGIRWNLAEGAGTIAANSAASGPEYDGQVTNPASPAWAADGAFKVPFAGRNDLVLASNRILKGWTNVALSSRQGRGLRFAGTNSGKVKESDAFKPSSTFALEAWILPTVLNQKQIILEKTGSYSLYVNTLGQVCLKVELKQQAVKYEEPPKLFSHEVKIAVTPGKTAYIAANFTTGSVSDEPGSKDYVQQKYFIKASVSVNGGTPATNNREDLTRPVEIRVEDTEFLVAKAGSGTFHYQGLLSHIRVWSRTLGQAETTATNALRLTPPNRDGLVAGWDFDETKGTAANDITGNHVLELTSNQLWTVWQDVAQAEIIVNGRQSLPLPVTPDAMGGYGDTQMTFGACIQSGTTVAQPLHGEIDDIRLFNTRLTEQQVRESMNKPLSGGEDHLAAYWRIDAGSGPVIFDMTGRGNNGRLKPDTAPPVWRNSSAPLQNEGQYVVNALGGTPDYYVAQIAGAPAVSEYAAAERDAYGQIYSVMKRGYFYQSATGETELRTGYKVGDLDTIFVGQVQSKPTIVGYIEGGPPIPSENQTLAFWVGDGGGPARAYAGISTVLYQETETKTWTFTANRSSTFNGALNVKGGPIWKGKADWASGIGLLFGGQVADYEVKLGAKISLSGDIGSTDQVAQNHSNSVSLTSSLSPSGTWEAEDAILNMAVGRRYIQNNVGMALVKSATADLYMLALKGTQTPVGYVMTPNDSIPVDTNIIDFPINPRYVKNGTLDGKVGLMNDPSYPEADIERGSYFKPVEAYAIKRRIQQQEQQLKAYYDQYDVDKYRLLATYDSAKEKLGKSPAFNFGENRNLRSMFNNYVWTAAGGLHREEWSTANSYTETYTGASTLKFGVGAETGAKVASPVGGFYIEADAMLGNTWSATASKATSTQNGYRLTCNVLPTDFLAAPILTKDGTGKLVFSGYHRDAAPGKVDAYRYMSFLIAPEEANFTALAGVVDQNWLNNATTAGAAAMREAMVNPAQPWRILYRTTFVSRVPAPFQAVKDDTDAPNITPPANLPSNSWLLRVLDQMIGKPDPTRLEIGTAIDALLGSRDTGAGQLVSLIPWWADFYAAAQVYGSPEFRELAELRASLLSYVASKYEAQAYAGR